MGLQENRIEIAKYSLQSPIFLPPSFENRSRKAPLFGRNAGLQLPDFVKSALENAPKTRARGSFAGDFAGREAGFNKFWYSLLKTFKPA
jgi:hypothetical protein